MVDIKSTYFIKLVGYSFFLIQSLIFLYFFEILNYSKLTFERINNKKMLNWSINEEITKGYNYYLNFYANIEVLAGFFIKQYQLSKKHFTKFLNRSKLGSKLSLNAIGDLQKSIYILG